MIRICPRCSGMDLDELKQALLGKQVVGGCLGQCGKDNRAYIDGELVIVESIEEIIEKVK